jgi:SNF2 family DNA or RNA helicase
VIYKPMAHQAISLKHNEKTPIVYDASDAGTGKTAVRIWRFAKRRAKGGGCMLVLGIRSTLRSVWVADFKKFAPHLAVAVAPAEKREAAFASKADVYITNHDATKWLAKQKPEFFKRFDEITIDEAPAFKHYSSARSRAILKIMKHFKYRNAMSATPNTNSIVDIWHQVLLLDGGKRLGNLYHPFRQSVASPVQVGNSTKMVEWTDKDGAEEAVFSLLTDIVIRHKLDDCADIPENHQYPIFYEMSDAQKRAYLDMELARILDVGTTITAINAAAVATKLLQVASGAVYTGGGKYHIIDTSRYELVMDLAESRHHPLVLFMWKHQRDLLVIEAEKRGLTFAVFDGDTSDKERLAIIERYQAGVYDVLLAQADTIGHGQTLTSGTSTIWASPTHDLETFIQASSRQRRIGQTRKTETVVVIAEDTVDEWAYENMLNKGVGMTSLLELFESITAKAKPTASVKPRTRKTAL